MMLMWKEPKLNFTGNYYSGFPNLRVMQSRTGNKCANIAHAYFHEPPSGEKWDVCWRCQIFKLYKGSYKPSHHHAFVFLTICVFLCVLLTCCLCSPPATRGGLSYGLVRLLSTFIISPLHYLETSQNNLPALHCSIQHRVIKVSI